MGVRVGVGGGGGGAAAPYTWISAKPTLIVDALTALIFNCSHVIVLAEKTNQVRGDPSLARGPTVRLLPSLNWMVPPVI